MYLILFGAAIVIFPIWVILVILKTLGIVTFCSWKILLLPVWVVIFFAIMYTFLAIGFLGIVLAIEAISQ